MITRDELDELLRSRRSVRKFKRDMLPRAVVESLIESAITAPSASNKQPWRFLVIMNRSTIDEMAAAVRMRVDEIARAIDPSFEKSFRAYGDYFTRFENAPVVIAALHKPLTVLSHMLDDVSIATMEKESGLIGTAMAMQNLLLAAHASGLGASGMTGPLVAAEALRAILRVPPSWSIAALIALGYADETPAPTERKPADKVTQWIE